MAYCGWPVNVNKIILDSTPVTVGEGATVQDSLEAGGLKKSRLTCSNPPDKFSVTMDFDFSEKKYLNNKYTECDLFWAWYKTVHKYGTVPFQFPAILINSNRQEGYCQEEIGHGSVPDLEYYCITSAVNGEKSGLSQRVTMTWETYATGVMQVEEEEFGVDHINATNGKIEVVLNSTPQYEPDSSTWTVYYRKVVSGQSDVTGTLLISGCEFDGDRTAYLYFEEITEPGTYIITIADAQPEGFVVS